MNDDYIRIPVVVKDDEKLSVLALKQAAENRLGKSLTWAALVRESFKALEREINNATESTNV